MSTNLILHTEDFSNAEWTNTGVTLTSGFAAAPTAFGPLAGLATKFNDASAVTQANVAGTAYTVPANSTIMGSVFILKDAVTSRQPLIILSLTGGTAKTVTVILNTSTGAATVPTGDGTAPTAFGIINFDSLWWRLWIKQTDVGSNTAARITIYPASYDSVGDVANAANTGFIVAGYVNLMVSTTLDTYQPAPTYAFSETIAWAPIQHVVRGQRVRVVTSGMTPPDFPAS